MISKCFLNNEKVLPQICHSFHESLVENITSYSNIQGKSHRAIWFLIFLTFISSSYWSLLWLILYVGPTGWGCLNIWSNNFLGVSVEGNFWMRLTFKLVNFKYSMLRSWASSLHRTKTDLSPPLHPWAKRNSIKNGLPAWTSTSTFPWVSYWPCFSGRPWLIQ